MTTYPASRPVPAARPAAAPAPQSGLGFAPVDPVRMLRQYKWWLLGSILAGAVIGWLLNIIIGATWPYWRSEVMYQCLSVQQDPTKAQYPMQDKDEMERFLLTTATVINSDRIIRQALVDSPKTFEVDTRWGQLWTTDRDGKVDIAKGLKELKKVVGANVVSGTNLIRLSVTTQRADDSAAIARAIHDSYWKDWKVLSQQQNLEQRGPLERQETDLRGELSNLDSKRDRMLVDKGIDDLKSVKGAAADLAIEELTKQIGDATRLREVSASLIGAYEKHAQTGSIPDEIRETIERDQVVVDLKARVESARSQLAAMSRLGDDHPIKVATKQALESYEASLSTAREAQMRKIFDGALDSARKQLDTNNNQLAEFNRKLGEAIARKKEIVRTLSQFDQLEKDREVLVTRLETVRGALNALNLTTVTANDRIDRVRILTPATAPDTRYFPKWEIMIPLGMVVCFGLTAGIIFLRELLDQRIKGPSDLLSVPRIRLVGTVPSVEADPTRPAPETALRDQPTGAVADAFRQARAGLIKRMQSAGYKSLLVFSGNPQSGSTSAAVNLAIGSAQADLRVLLVDANFRRPSMHRVLGVAEGPGLGDVLAKKSSLDAAVQHVPTVGGLHLLAAGSAASRGFPERLSTDTMSNLIQEASQKYDLVVLDCAPATVAGDAAALANRVDCSLMVVKALGEKRGLIARMRDQFNESRGEFMGVLINGVRVTGTGYMAQNIKSAQEYQNASV